MCKRSAGPPPSVDLDCLLGCDPLLHCGLRGWTAQRIGQRTDGTRTWGRTCPRTHEAPRDWTPLLQGEAKALGGRPQNPTWPSGPGWAGFAPGSKQESSL
jgi:hypothetical protein